MRLFNLIRNEQMKIYRRPRTWVMAILMVCAIAGIGILMRTHMNSASLSNMNAWLFAQYMITRIGSLIAVFVCIVAGDTVASEFAGGTIKMLLARPVYRAEVLTSKFIATLIFAFLMTLLTLAAGIVIGMLLFGSGGYNAPFAYATPAHVMTQMPVGSSVWMFAAFQFIDLVMIVTIAFMISAIFRSSALAIGISILTLFVGSAIVGFLSSYHWDKYILFANMNLSQYVVGGPRIAGMTLGFSITMLVLYFAAMLVLSWQVFGRRDVAA